MVCSNRSGSIQVKRVLGGLAVVTGRRSICMGGGIFGR